MTWMTFFQLIADSAFIAITAFLWIKSRKPPQDDPRLSRGLQLLQSKITVLEDLSDRTDAQVKQLTQILDQKTRYIQDKIVLAEQQILKIDQSMEKSLEVAEIFQDKIPHQEVLERKRTVEYVKAARLANQGRGANEIASQVDLPREQIELIAKFNRDQLMFDEEALPAWAKNGAEKEANASSTSGNIDFLNSLEAPKPDLTSLNSIGEKFKTAIRAYETAAPPIPPAAAATAQPSADADDTSAATRAILGAAQSISNSLKTTAANFLSMPEPPPSKPQPVVKKVEFPRIQMPK